MVAKVVGARVGGKVVEARAEVAKAEETAVAAMAEADRKSVV